jgi:hypothetical protein
VSDFANLTSQELALRAEVLANFLLESINITPKQPCIVILQGVAVLAAKVIAHIEKEAPEKDLCNGFEDVFQTTFDALRANNKGRGLN